MSLKLGVVGVGSLGYHHARIARELPNSKLVGVHDANAERLRHVAQELSVSAFSDLGELLEKVDACIIAVTTSAHEAVALQALERGVHVLIEKPIAPSIDAADRILAAAGESGATVQIGHVERFNSALRACEPYLDEPMFVESHRLAPFGVRGTDVAVVLDLMIHDLDLVLSLMKRPVTSVGAVGVPVLTNHPDIANARLEFEGGGVANLTASRVSLERMRKIRFFQRSGYISLDLASGTGSFLRVKEGLQWEPGAPFPAEKLEQIIERISLQGDQREPLRAELESFVAALRGEAEVAVTGREGRDALAVALEIVRRIDTYVTERTPAQAVRAAILPRAGLLGAGRHVRHRDHPDGDAVPNGMSADAPRILLSAGEPSGDLHGAALARELKRRWPNAKLYGFGGDLMRAAGVELWAHADQMAVMGFVEVARHLPFFLSLLWKTRDDLRADPPDLVIPIDYPGFNLRLARYAKELRIPVLYYIAPQVWAWHRSRMKELANNADHLAVVLPFEEKLFREAGATVTFVGHPLLDLPTSTRTREEFCATYSLDAHRPIVALLPGSRQQEIRNHAQLFVDAARLLQRQQPEVQPVIAQAPGIAAESLAGFGYPLVNNSSDLLTFAQAALTKSGTSTLECALSLTPMVIAYRMNPISFLIARNVVEVEHIGLVNLIAGERVAPEFVQDDATPDALAQALAPLTRAGPEREKHLTALRGVRQKLAGDARGAAVHVADLVAELLRKP